MYKTEHKETSKNTPYQLMIGRTATFPDDFFPGSVKLVVSNDNARSIQSLWKRTKLIMSKVLDQLGLAETEIDITFNDEFHPVDDEGRNDDAITLDESEDVGSSWSDTSGESGDDLALNELFGDLEENDEEISASKSQVESRKLGPWVVIDNFTGKRNFTDNIRWDDRDDSIDFSDVDLGIDEDLRRVFEIVRNRNVRSLSVRPAALKPDKTNFPL